MKVYDVMLLVEGDFWVSNNISIMMITLPIFMPIVAAVRFDPLMFGILFLLNIGIALLTPPFGLLIFVMKGVSPPEVSIGTLYRTSVPWVIMMLAAMGLVALFPQIALWLPAVLH